MPYDERWLTDLLARSQVRVVGDSAPPIPPVLSEAVFQAAVIELARGCGWMLYHTFDSRRSPSGFPDLVLAHPAGQRPLVCAELKTDTGQLTKAQEAWLTALAGSTGVVSTVWRPHLWPAIVEQLRG